MRRMLEPGVFMPTLSRAEAKSDATTRAARAIIDGEAAARLAKTERLRATRLAREAVEEPTSAPIPARRKR